MPPSALVPMSGRRDVAARQVLRTDQHQAGQLHHPAGRHQPVSGLGSVECRGRHYAHAMPSEGSGTGRPAAWPRWAVAFVAMAGAFSLIVAVVIWAVSGPGGALSPAVGGVMLLSLALQGALRKPARGGGHRRYWRGQSPGFLLASAIVASRPGLDSRVCEESLVGASIPWLPKLRRGPLTNDRISGPALSRSTAHRWAAAVGIVGLVAASWAAGYLAGRRAKQQS